MNYALVSEGAILRDYIKPEYLDAEHKMLVDIADFLYNANLGAEHLTPDAKEAYNKQGKEFWKLVLRDMGALDSQLDHQNAGELLEEYKELLDEVKNNY